MKSYYTEYSSGRNSRGKITIRVAKPSWNKFVQFALFTVIVSTIATHVSFAQLLSPPVLDSPSNGSVDQPLEPTLRWNSSIGATSYQLQVSESPLFGTTVFDEASIVDTSRKIGLLAYATTYYWRVRAQGLLTTSDWSNVWSFTTIPAPPAAPLLSAPANSATDQATSLTLQWNASSGATSYRLQVSTSASFASTVVDDATLTVTQRQVGALTNATTYYWRVLASNSGGTSSWSDVWSFTTISALPAAPVLATPANTATDQATSLTLQWNASSGATSYRLQVSTSASFASTVVDDATLTVAQRQVDALSNATTYYWRVSASNSGGASSWSDVWSFTTVAAPPAAPVPSAPANSATDQATSLTLQWNASSGATSYRLQVSTSASFASTVVDDATLIVTQRQVDALSNATTYYWRVLASNSGGASSWSDTWSFTTAAAPQPVPAPPTLSSPSDSAAYQPTTLTLTWNASTGTTNYHLQVSTSSAFESLVFRDTTLAGVSMQVGPLATGTTHYWRVGAKNSSGWSNWSNVWSFTTANPPTATTNPATDVNGISATFHGVVNPNGLSTHAKFQFGLSTSYGNSITAYESPVSGTTPVAVSVVLRGLVPNTTYHFRLTTTNSAGVGYGEDRAFTTLPDEPALVSPPNGTSDLSLTPTLSWNSMPGIVAYRLQLSTSTTFGSGFDDSTITGTSSQVGPLARNTTYYWRLQAKNSGGWGAWSSIWSFRTIPDPPPSPATSSPTNGSSNVSTTLTLQWIATSGASQYRLQVATDASFSSLVVHDSTLTTTSREVGPLATGTTYYWRVAAINTGGSSNWSNGWSFVTQGSALTQDVALPAGWNMISSFVQPRDPTLDSVCLAIRNQMILMKNGSGRVYWPAYTINTIGNWNYQHGYQIYMQSPGAMVVGGSEILPEVTQLQLAQGWNMIGYLRNNAMRIDQAVQSISSAIVLAKNNAGQVYWPEYGINTIGAMEPSQGYQLYLSQSGTLTYPSNSSPPSASTRAEGRQPDKAQRTATYFTYTANTGNNATVAIPASAEPRADGIPLEIGDEIGAFTPTGLCIGAAIWEGTNTAITIWGDDDRTPGVDGIRGQEQIHYRVWQNSKNKELSAVQVTYAQGDGMYAPNGIYALSSLKASSTTDIGLEEQFPKTFSLSQNFPNPFNPSTIIAYGLPKASNVKIDIFNTMGQHVTTLVNEKQDAGYHSVAFQSGTLSSGVYIYRIQADAFFESKKMLIVR